MNRSKGIFLLVLGLLLVATVSLVGYKTYLGSYAAKPTQKTALKEVLVRRSKILGVILKAVTAKAIDVKTGKVIQAAGVFSLGDKTIYLALDLNSARFGTYIDYIRYLNGRYVDHGDVKISKDATRSITFNWTNVRPLGSIGDGKWKIATYTNGILEKRVSYLVKKGNVSKLYPEEPILSSNPDYQLVRTLAMLKAR